MNQTKTVFSIQPGMTANGSGTLNGESVDCSGWDAIKSVFAQSVGDKPQTGRTIAFSNMIVQGSNDNSNWTSLSVSGGVNLTPGHTSQEVGYLSGRIGYRYVRHQATISGTGQYCSFFELDQGRNLPTTAAAHGASGYFAGNI